MSAGRTFDRRQMDFLLHDVQRCESLCAYPRYAAHARETFDAVLDAAEALARQHFAPNNAAGGSGPGRARCAVPH